MIEIDCAVAIIFNDEGKILLTQRNDPQNPFAHMKWQFPGGGVENGESPSEAALREILEETGLIIELLSDMAIRYDHPEDNGKYLIKLFGFPAKFIGGELDLTKDVETHDAKWFTYEEIPFADSLPFTKELVDDAVKYMHQQTISGEHS